MDPLPQTTDPPCVVVMRVARAGELTIRRLLAPRLGWSYVDADESHPSHHISNMRAGLQLDDGGRLPWLRAVASEVRAVASSGERTVVACSTLKRQYRDVPRATTVPLAFVHLVGAFPLLRGRLGQRTGHFMPPALLASQLADLEPLSPDERGFEIDAARLLGLLASHTTSGARPMAHPESSVCFSQGFAAS